MPDLPEESLWHWGCVTSSLRDTGEPAQRRVEACLVLVWMHSLLLPSEISAPSQLLKVKQGYSPSVAYFFLPPLSCFYHKAPVVEAVSVCVGSGSLGCRVSASGAPCQRKRISWAKPRLADNCSQVYQTRMLPADLQKWDGSTGTDITITPRKWTWGDNFYTQL